MLVLIDVVDQAEVVLLDQPLLSRLDRREIIEYLKESWAIHRKAEWSIRMVYSKAEMPHQYLSTPMDSSYHCYGPLAKKV